MTDKPQNVMEAILEVQRRMPPLKPDKVNTFNKFEYVTLDKIRKKLLPIANEVGLVIMQNSTAEKVEIKNVEHGQYSHYLNEAKSNGARPLEIEERRQQRIQLKAKEKANQRNSFQKNVNQPPVETPAIEDNLDYETTNKNSTAYQFVRIETILYCNGDERTFKMHPQAVPLVGNTAQEMGKVITYMERYHLSMLFGIATGTEFDEMQQAQFQPQIFNQPVQPQEESVISSEQKKQLENKIAAYAKRHKQDPVVTTQGILMQQQVEFTSEIPVSKFNEIMTLLDQ